MNENDLRKLRKEHDCPICFESEPYDWCQEKHGLWQCKCRPRGKKITIADIDKALTKIWQENASTEAVDLHR